MKTLAYTEGARRPPCHWGDECCTWVDVEYDVEQLGPWWRRCGPGACKLGDRWHRTREAAITGLDSGIDWERHYRERAHTFRDRPITHNGD